jgi:hypothetical protein
MLLCNTSYAKIIGQEITKFMRIKSVRFILKAIILALMSKFVLKLSLYLIDRSNKTFQEKQLKVEKERQNHLKEDLRR